MSKITPDVHGDVFKISKTLKVKNRNYSSFWKLKNNIELWHYFQRSLIYLIIHSLSFIDD